MTKNDSAVIVSILKKIIDKAVLSDDGTYYHVDELLLNKKESELIIKIKKEKILMDKKSSDPNKLS